MSTPVLLLLVGGGAGLVLILGIGIALLSGGRAANVNQRLDQISGAEWEAEFLDPNQPETRTSSSENIYDRIDDAIDSRGFRFADRIRQRIAQGDLKLRVSEFVLLIVVLAIAGAAAGYFLFNNALFAILGFLLGSQIPGIYARIAARRRMKAFVNQLSDTLNLWVNALRSGYSVLQAMEAIGSELPPPISQEFERAIQEMRLGIDMETALDNILRRAPSEDFDLVVTAVKVQREVGGNLSEILDIISHTIRERVRIKGEIQTLTAQGRISGWVITLLPIGLGLFLYQINPEYIGEMIVREGQPLFPPPIPCGWLMIGVAATMIMAGGFAIQKIIDIEV
ncbi:MAG: type II secretion system F family protein [Chloroflexota bacterium]